MGVVIIALSALAVSFLGRRFRLSDVHGHVVKDLLA